MKRFIERKDRRQITLMLECLQAHVGADDPVRAVEAFVEQLDLHQMRLEGSRMDSRRPLPVHAAEHL
jgi:hypothetical protein